MKKKEINILTILSDIVQTFIISCGLVLLLVFFYIDYKTLSQNDIRNMVLLVFITLLIILMFWNLLSNGGYWFHEKSSTEISNIDDKAIELLKKDNAVTQYNKKIASVHEAGHAVMAHLKDIDYYNVFMNGPNPRVEMQCKCPDKNTIKNSILILYAGAVAEELFFGNFHYSCMGSDTADFDTAAKYIKGYILMNNPNVSKTMLDEEISTEMIIISKQFYQETKDTLSDYADAIRNISERLMKENTLTKEQIKEIICNTKQEISANKE